MNYDKTIKDTLTHVKLVSDRIDIICKDLKRRARTHDKSKMFSPEVDVFADTVEDTENIKYGSDKYNEILEKLEPALTHHYSKNRHHAQHFPNGIAGMNLIDLVEMLCDWSASCARYKDGNILTSISINTERFNISPDLSFILRNTAELFELLPEQEEK